MCERASRNVGLRIKDLPSDCIKICSSAKVTQCASKWPQIWINRHMKLLYLMAMPDYLRHFFICTPQTILRPGLTCMSNLRCQWHLLMLASGENAVRVKDSIPQAGRRPALPVFWKKYQWVAGRHFRICLPESQGDHPCRDHRFLNGQRQYAVKFLAFVRFGGV